MAGYSLRVQQAIILHDRGFDPTKIAATLQIRKIDAERALRKAGIIIHNGQITGSPEIFTNKDVPEHLYAARDPCFWCGTRSDLGCAHQ